MYTSADYKAGKGRKVSVKASTSVLPYLKAKQVNVVHNPEVTGAGGKEEHKAPPTPAPKPKDQYNEARMEILREHTGGSYGKSEIL